MAASGAGGTFSESHGEAKAGFLDPDQMNAAATMHDRAVVAR
jgi:hypothetical protein